MLVVLLAFVAYASAGILLAPTAYSAEGVHQIHSPWAVSSSSRVQSFNGAAILGAAPLVYY